jgi:hypothetical protein
MKRSRILFQFAIVMILCLVGTAFAAEAPAVTDFGAALTGFLIYTVLPLVAALVSGYGLVLVNKLRIRWNIKILNDNAATIDALAEKAIRAAEEMGAAYIKTKLGPKDWTGNEKLEYAITSIMKAAPHVSREKADELVHSTLARLSGVGATGEKSVK